MMLKTIEIRQNLNGDTAIHIDPEALELLAWRIAKGIKRVFST